MVVVVVVDVVVVVVVVFLLICYPPHLNLFPDWTVPDIQTVAESGYRGYEAITWYAVWGPKNLPAAIIARLNSELNAVLSDPAVREHLSVLGIDPTPVTPDQFQEEIRRDLSRYGAVVRAAGIKAE